MTGLGGGMPRTTGAILRRTAPAWIALMVLLAATVAGAYLKLGAWNLALGLGIACAKAAIVMLVFMRLRRPDPLLRLAAIAAPIFIAFLFLLTYADILRRPAPTQPGTVTPRTIADEPATGRRAF